MHHFHIPFSDLSDQEHDLILKHAIYSRKFERFLAFSCATNALHEWLPCHHLAQPAHKNQWLSHPKMVTSPTCPKIIAGPCTIESPQQLDEVATLLKHCGVHAIRGGARKARTSPYDFQGHGKKALYWLQSAAKKHELTSVSELTTVEEASLFQECIDIIQIGARNMQHYPLLQAAGKTKKPILLKRGFSNTYEEWQSAAEYCLYAGAPVVYLCERGIRSFEPSTRFTLDLLAIPVMQQRTWLPIIVDPSHACGNRSLVAAMSRAALAAGASGLMLEIHDQPENALCDGPQALTYKMFEDLIASINNGVYVL